MTLEDLYEKYPILVGRSFSKHENGSGWVESTCNVSESVFVNSDSVVCGTCTITENVKILGSSLIYGNCNLSGSVRVYDKSKILDNATLYGDCEIRGNSKIRENATVCGKAKLSEFCDIYGNSIIKGEAKIFGRAKIGGDVVMDFYMNACEDMEITVQPQRIPIVERFKLDLVTSDSEICSVGCFVGNLDQIHRNHIPYGISFGCTEEEISQITIRLNNLINKL